MTRVIWVFRDRRMDCGTYPTEQAEAFRLWAKAWCPNRWYIFESVVQV